MKFSFLKTSYLLLHTYYFILTTLYLLLFTQCSPTKPLKNTSPNILLIIVDDLGYSDLGCYGSEIDTRNIDALAEKGIRFTNFYASPNCSPTRSMLMSGMDNHQAGIGTMKAVGIGDNQKGKAGYEGHLNKNTVAFSELLKDKGYRNYYAGKWHLGTNDVAHPNARGFDEAWWQVGGSPGSHFDWSAAPNRPNYFENDKQQQIASDTFFSTNFYTDQLLHYLEKDKNTNQPFLGILSFSAVHIPIHCPQSHIDLYKEKYNDGYEALKNKRLQKQKKLGIVSQDILSAQLPPNTTAWDDLSEKEQAYNARRMEVYAGMVDNMDDNIGKVVDYLKKTGQYENTLIVVMSDNGGAGFNGWQSPKGKKRFEAANNTIENLGKQGSVNYIGAGWGSAISTPFRLFKRHITEGGLRIPVIISGGYLSKSNTKKQQATINHHVFTVRDIAPTIQEIAGATYPTDEYKDRKILPQTGKSFSKLLNEDATLPIHKADEIFGWELFKRKAVQKNGWKILWIEKPFGKGKWELYHLKEDPTEQNDLAQTHPKKLEEMIKAWEKYQEENNVIISNSELKFP